MVSGGLRVRAVGWAKDSLSRLERYEAALEVRLKP